MSYRTVQRRLYARPAPWNLGERIVVAITLGYSVMLLAALVGALMAYAEFLL